MLTFRPFATQIPDPISLTDTPKLKGLGIIPAEDDHNSFATAQFEAVILMKHRNQRNYSKIRMEQVNHANINSNNPSIGSEIDWRVDLLRPSSWLQHTPFAFWIVNAARPNCIVELGTHTGVSYFAFCQAVERIGLSTKCFAIDTWTGDVHSGYYEEDVFNDVNAVNDQKYRSFSYLLRMTFDEAHEYFADGEIDLLHIDGLHTYDAVAHDFATWKPKLSSRAIVIFHDINVREREFGVWRFWKELTEQFPYSYLLNESLSQKHALIGDNQVLKNHIEELTKNNQTLIDQTAETRSALGPSKNKLYSSIEANNLPRGLIRRSCTSCFLTCTKFGLMKWFEGFDADRIRVSENFNPSYTLSWIASEAEQALRRDVSDEAADAFAREPINTFVRYWRDESSRMGPESVWQSFKGLSQASQEVIGAGFEYLGRKPVA